MIFPTGWDVTCCQVSAVSEGMPCNWHTSLRALHFCLYKEIYSPCLIKVLAAKAWHKHTMERLLFPFSRILHSHCCRPERLETFIVPIPPLSGPFPYPELRKQLPGLSPLLYSPGEINCTPQRTASSASTPAPTHGGPAIYNAASAPLWRQSGGCGNKPGINVKTAKNY